MLLVMTSGSPLVSLEQAAELCNVVPRTLINQISRGEAPFKMFKAGSRWAAHVSDVADWIDTQKAAA